MKIGVQIPIKGDSERIPQKNFVPLGGYPLYWHLLEELTRLPDRYHLFIDTDIPYHFSENEQIRTILSRYCLRHRPTRIQGDWVNGNHLLSDFENTVPHFDLYIQAFVTAPFLKAKTIETAVAALLDNAGRDSLVPGTYQGRFLWSDGHPNYVLGSPAGFGRLQDRPVFIESTGFYIIRPEALRKYGTRTGLSPMLFEIPEREAIDIDTPWDLEVAEALWKD